MSCEEKINMDAMKRILANFDALWDDGKITQKDNNYHVVEDKEIARTILTKFYNAHDSNGIARVQYKPSKENPDGRLYAPYSLQTICRPVRHTISTGLIDIDIVNCHPSLLKELLDKNSFPCPALTEYVTRREDAIKTLTELYGMSREKVKEKVVAIINGQAVKDDDDEWFHDLAAEVRQITSKVSILYPKMYCRAMKVGGDVTHRALNYELCRLERTKLDAMVSFCKKKKIKIAALCHDGLMLYRETTIDYNAVCNELSAVCGMPVVVKPFNEAIDLTKLPNTEIAQVELVDDQPVVDLPCEAYNVVKKKMEQTFFKTLSPYRFVEERDGTLYEWKHRDFLEAFQNVYCYAYDKREGMTNKHFVPTWLADPEIRTYHHFAFDPSGNCPKDVYNQFKGFNADRMGGDPDLGQEGLQVWKEHLLVMCDFDEDANAYQEKWFAWAIQRPWLKIGVAIVYVGEQGSGKGTLGEHWGHTIIGKDYMVETSSINDIVTDGFNAATKDKLLVIFDESNADEASYDKMKNKITGKLQPLRQKYVDTKTNVKDYANIMFLSNNKTPVIIKPDERRHVIFRTSDKYCTMNKDTPVEEKKAYFDRLYRYMDFENPCPHTAAAIVQYLRSIDLTGFHPQMDRVLTKGYNQIKSFSMSTDLKFIKDFSDERCSRLAASSREKHTFYILGKDLYREYVDWNKDYNPQGKAVGKNTLFSRWEGYKFMTPIICTQKANMKYFKWVYGDLLRFWKDNGYDMEAVEEIDAFAHARLLSQQV